MTEMKEQYLEGATKEQISGYLRAAVGEPAMLTVWTEDISVTVYSEQTVQEHRISRWRCPESKSNFLRREPQNLYLNIWRLIWKERCFFQ